MSYELKKIDLLDYFKLPNAGLMAYFKRTEKGNNVEYRTPFYKGSDLKDLCDRWDKTLSSIANKYGGLYQFENHLREKVGPLSIQKPLAERMDDIESYYDLIELKSIPISNAAISQCFKEFRSAHGLRLRSVELTLDKMKKSTNSGAPLFRKKSTVIEATRRGSITIENQKIEGTDYVLCAIIGWRGQENGPEYDDVKQRVIWMMPFLVNINELRLYQPAIESFQKLKLNPSWISNDAVDARITKLFDTKDKRDYIMCTDFEKFDQHFNSDMSECARTIIAGLMTPNATSDWWLDEIFPIKYKIPMIVSSKLGIFGIHGMASGSGGTNFDETMTHRALQHEAALLAGQKLNLNSICLGDDGIISYPGIDQDHVMKVYTSHGQEMNDFKQDFSQNECNYLRRWHSYDYRVKGICVGVYSTFRALNRLCEQERYYDPKMWGPKAVALRQLSILENVKWHPLREEFVRFCIKGDRFRLGLDIPGFMANIAAEARKATNMMPDFLGYNRTEMSDEKGIDQWWIVKYLKSIS